MSVLYLVGTPIGNLGDITQRALEILRQVDFIAAEDTRVSLKLLRRFEIQKPLVSYHQHNVERSGQKIIERIIGGESCALITDAGMPCISDPGEELVRLCVEHEVRMEVIPGPSAVISALALSGLSAGRFTFEGFLSISKNSRFEHLESLKKEHRTMIFYEAPHKLLATLKDFLLVLGNRKIAIARELTKIHEEVIRTNISDAIEHFSITPPRGEFVLVLEGKEEEKAARIPFEEAIEQVNNLRQSGQSASAAAREVAEKTGYKKSELYSHSHAADIED